MRADLSAASATFGRFRGGRYSIFVAAQALIGALAHPRGHRSVRWRPSSKGNATRPSTMRHSDRCLDGFWQSGDPRKEGSVVAQRRVHSTLTAGFRRIRRCAPRGVGDSSSLSSCCRRRRQLRRIELTTQSQTRNRPHHIVAVQPRTMIRRRIRSAGTLPGTSYLVSPVPPRSPAFPCAEGTHRGSLSLSPNATSVASFDSLRTVGF
jgi:hypothetical protein